MKKIVMMVVIISFLATSCTPSAMRAAALGGTLGTIAVLGISSHLRDRTSVAAKRDVDIENVKAFAASGAKVSCGDVPCENSYTSDTAGTAIVRYAPIVQPITQNVRPLVSHKNGNGGESALCRAGREAALSGIGSTCERDDPIDYCLCYEATKERR